jgi:hypothetical protein
VQTKEATAPHPHTRAVLAVLFRAYRPVGKKNRPEHVQFREVVARLFSVSNGSAHRMCDEFGFDAYQYVRS